MTYQFQSQIDWCCSVHYILYDWGALRYSVFSESQHARFCCCCWSMRANWNHLININQVLNHFFLFNIHLFIVLTQYWSSCGSRCVLYNALLVLIICIKICSCVVDTYWPAVTDSKLSNFCCAIRNAHSCISYIFIRVLVSRLKLYMFFFSFLLNRNVGNKN